MNTLPFASLVIAQALPIHAFVETNHRALRHAARLLGGCESMRLVDEIHAALQSEATIPDRTALSLAALHDLLRLEHVGEPDRPEAGFFAMIDPHDPVVEDLCLLTDGLTAALTEWDTLRQRSCSETCAEQAAA